MQIKQLLTLVMTALEDLKAQEIKVLDVREKTSVTDYMIVVTGSSTRHVKAIAQNVAFAAKKTLQRTFSTEGEESGEWVLVDLEDIVVHVMLRDARTHYSLEKLWETTDARRQHQQV